MERQRSAAGKIAAWKKGIAAAAAAAFIMAGSLGINMATKGPQVVNVPGDPGQDTNIVAYNNDEKPATGTKNEPTKPEQEDPKTEPGETNVGAETGDVQPGSNNSKPEQTATGGQKPTQGNNTGNAATAIKNEPQAVLLGSNMVIKSTVLKLMVSDTDLAREKAEGLTATVGGKASYLGEQNTGSGIVNLLRITVSKDTAVKTVNSLAALGTTISRNDENRNITSQYNSLAARYNELVESSQDTPEATAEIESMKQQLDQWAEDAEVYTVVLWLQ